MKKTLTTLIVLLLFSGNGFAEEEIKEVIIFEKLDKDEIALLLGEHNRVRAGAGLSSLEWSEDLSDYAEEWANHLAATGCNLDHRPKSGKWKRKYGENLFMGVAENFGILHTVTTWEREKKNYSYGPVTEQNRFATENYTQLVWKDTERVGCAKAICSGNMVIVCNYDPPGNVPGEKPY